MDEIDFTVDLTGTQNLSEAVGEERHKTIVSAMGVAVAFYFLGDIDYVELVKRVTSLAKSPTELFGISKSLEVLLTIKGDGMADKIIGRSDNDSNLWDLLNRKGNKL